jgi:hypothetical protein
MTKLNPKQHALMRYLSRIHNEIIITDNAFRDWREKYPERVERANRQLIELSGNCELIIIGKYNKDNQEREYRISTEEQLILVCDKDNLLTVYPIEFGDGISKETNLIIFDALHKNYLELIQQKEIFREQNNNTVEDSNEQIDRIENSIKLKKSEIQELEILKTEHENRKKEIKLKEEQLELKIKDVARKIVNPAFSFRG